MRVVHVLRVDAGLYYGGGEVQAEKTRAALAKSGVDVHVHHSLDRDVGDLVHFFGLFDSHSPIAEHCVSRDIPYVVSPIFVTPRSKRRLRWRSFRQRYLDFRFPRNHLRLLTGAREIYPLTCFEQDNLQIFFPGLDSSRFRRIPNGVDTRFSDADPELFRRQFGISGSFVLHAATIERSKNQLGLIHAMRGSDVPVVFLGRIHDDSYWRECQDLFTSNMRHLGNLPYEGDLLPSAYAAASVFCLPSRREILPLSAMEATVAGCSIVLGSKWGGQEIWGDTARFVDPDDPGEIRVAVEAALTDKADPTRASDFLAAYSWDAVASILAERYRSLVRLT